MKKNPFHFTNVSEKTILDFLKKLKTNKATGIDNLSGKAFDTTDHKILVEKMKCVGFSNDVTKWFECYLSKRMFSVHVENSFSDKAAIICGVPQGSILGPLVFSLYVNDIVQAVNCDLRYADGTGLIFQHKDINIIEHQLNRKFSNICDRFVDK